MTEKHKLNLGAGKDIRPDYVNHDIAMIEGIDEVHDLNDIPWPWPDDRFSEIVALDVLEHLDNFFPVMEEIYRVLKPKGVIRIKVPYWNSAYFHIDPTHINPIHPDLLAFMIKRSGFDRLKYYFINGGPLQNSEADLLTRVFNGVAQDVVLVGSKSNQIDNSIFENPNLIIRDMSVGLTSLEAAIEFDNYSRNRYAQYDEAIFLMRKRITCLERQLQHYARLYDQNFFSILIKIIRKVKSKVFTFYVRFNNKIKSSFRFQFNNKSYITFIKRIYKIQSIFYLLRYLEKILDHIGFRVYQYKLVKKSKKMKEDFELVAKHDNSLATYFNSSDDAKNILKDLNKNSQL